MVRRYLKRFPPAIAGIAYALVHDFSYRWQVITIIVTVSLFAFLFGPFTTTEWMFLGASATFILITELQNSALEAALDQIHPDRSAEIGRSKDMAAGSVLLAGCFMLFVMVLIVLG